jgi:hypothetical protein
MAEDLYKHNNVRMVAFVAYRNSRGGVTTQMTDFNDLFGSNRATMASVVGKSNIEATGFMDLFDEYCEVAFTEPVAAEAGAGIGADAEVFRKKSIKRKEASRIALGATAGGRPVLPNPTPAKLPIGEDNVWKYQAKIMRTFVSLNYGEHYPHYPM